MTKAEWIEQFNKTKETFRWFIDDYFPGEFQILENLVKQEVVPIAMMNNIWYYLPDNKFNIIENPKGWSEFISLLEENIINENT